jgi:ubiquinol-cytochrome c reductase cytochrome c1 subunit
MHTKTFALTALALILMTAPGYAADAPAPKASPAAEMTIQNDGIAEEAGKGHAPKPDLPSIDWSFNGPFGTYDKAQLQRGFLVYKQVCSACHSMTKNHYRDLAALGYNEGQIKTIASEYTVMDGPNDEGDMFERPARASDKFKRPYENDKAAAYANGGALPPDLSLMTKARKGGADYVYALLTGYEAAPAGVTLLTGQHYNKYKDGNIIAMAAPLSEGQITYEDGSAQTVDQYSRDVSAFLAWAAEPEMEDRKRMGAKVVIFLAFFAFIMYLTKRKIWEKLH